MKVTPQAQAETKPLRVPESLYRWAAAVDGEHGERRRRFLAQCEAFPEVLEVLKALRAEAAGALGFARQYLVDGLGETNIACLENRIAEADAVIAKAEKVLP